MELSKEELKITRHNLASIDLSDIEEIRNRKFTEEELKARNLEIERFYHNILKDELRLFTQLQLEFIGKEAGDEIQSAFGRGGINAFSLLKEFCEAAVNASTPDPEGKIAPGEPFPEV